MIKNFSRIEYKIGNRNYEFVCEMDSPFVEIREALFHFIKQIGQIEDYAKAQELEKKSQETQQKEDKDDVSTDH